MAIFWAPVIESDFWQFLVMWVGGAIGLLFLLVTIGEIITSIRARPKRRMQLTRSKLSTKDTSGPKRTVVGPPEPDPLTSDGSIPASGRSSQPHQPDERETSPVSAISSDSINKTDWAGSLVGCGCLIWIVFALSMLSLGLVGAIEGGEAAVACLVTFALWAILQVPFSALSKEQQETPQLFPEGEDLDPNTLAVMGPIRLALLGRAGVSSGSGWSLWLQAILLLLAGIFVEVFSWAFALLGTPGGLIVSLWLGGKAASPAVRGARALACRNEYRRFRIALQNGAFTWDDVATARSGLVPRIPNAIWLFERFNGLVYLLIVDGNQLRLRSMKTPAEETVMPLSDIHSFQIWKLQGDEVKERRNQPPARQTVQPGTGTTEAPDKGIVPETPNAIARVWRAVDEIKTQPFDWIVTFTLEDAGGQTREVVALCFEQVAKTLDHWQGKSPLSVPPKTSKLAVASLSLSFLLGSGSIPAVICGHMARRRIRQSGGALKGLWLSLAGLILGYFGIAMFVAAMVSGFLLGGK